jgi:hypothetical protein
MCFAIISLRSSKSRGYERIGLIGLGDEVKRRGNWVEIRPNWATIGRGKCPGAGAVWLDMPEVEHIVSFARGYGRFFQLAFVVFDVG